MKLRANDITPLTYSVPGRKVPGFLTGPYLPPPGRLWARVSHISWRFKAYLDLGRMELKNALRTHKNLVDQRLMALFSASIYPVEVPMGYIVKTTIIFTCFVEKQNSWVYREQWSSGHHCCCSFGRSRVRSRRQATLGRFSVVSLPTSR